MFNNLISNIVLCTLKIDLFGINSLFVNLRFWNHIKLLSYGSIVAKILWDYRHLNAWALHFKLKQTFIQY